MTNVFAFRAACIAALIFALPAAAQERAGITQRVQQDAFQKTSFSPKTLKRNDLVFQDAVLYTEAAGSLMVELDDGTDLTLSPNSRVVVDEYVYDRSSGEGTNALRLTEGALRFVSGRMRKERVSLRTPVATIGIRGTDVTLQDTGSGILNIWLDEGAITATVIGSNQSFNFVAPVFAACSAAGCEVGDGPSRPGAFPAGAAAETDRGSASDDGDSSSSSSAD